MEAGGEEAVEPKKMDGRVADVHAEKAHEGVEGAEARVAISTGRPWLAAAMAQDRAAGPAPTMATSGCVEKVRKSIEMRRPLKV
jgi:hypothetical protein